MLKNMKKNNGFSSAGLTLSFQTTQYSQPYSIKKGKNPKSLSFEFVSFTITSMQQLKSWAGLYLNPFEIFTNEAI